MKSLYPEKVGKDEKD